MERRLEQLLGKLRRPKRKKEVKVIIDGENLLKSLEEIDRENSDLPTIISNLKGFLEEDEVIGEIYFFATYREKDREQEALSRKLKRRGIKVVLKSGKIIIPGMIRKSRIDAWIITEIMATIIANIDNRRNFKRIFLFSGDSDFEAPLKAARQQGIEATVISCRNNLYRELITVANQVIDLEKLLGASQ